MRSLVEVLVGAGIGVAAAAGVWRLFSSADNLLRPSRHGNQPGD
jgi:hypothetical protein